MSLELPLVSIIVSAYHNIQYLPPTLDSILQQTSTNFEVLVFSNDYSHTVGWFREQQDPRFKFFFPHNLGRAKTFNQGILKAKGKYVSWLDAGDIWHPTKLQKQLFCLERFPENGFVCSWLQRIDHKSSSTATIIKPEYLVGMNLLLREPNQGYAKSLMVRRSCLESIGLFDPKLKAIPGWDLWLRLNRRYQFIHIGEPLVSWYHHQGDLTEDWLILETDLQIIIEKFFLNYRENSSLNKRLSYGYNSLFLARTVLADQQADLAIAQNYCQQALTHHPALGLSSAFIRLQFDILALSCQRSSRYRYLLSLLRQTGSLLRSTSRLLRQFSHRLLDWMLEEEEIIIGSKNHKVTDYFAKIRRSLLSPLVKRQGKN